MRNPSNKIGGQNKKILKEILKKERSWKPAFHTRRESGSWTQHEQEVALFHALPKKNQVFMQDIKKGTGNDLLSQSQIPYLAWQKAQFYTWN